MARTADIQDAVLREQLEEAERLIDADRYREAVELCANSYLLVMQKSPELIPPVPAAPVPGFRGGGGGPGPTGGPPGAGPTAVWPLGLGLRIVFDEEKKPELTFEKERFNFSETATYFEFTLDFVIRAERT